MLAKGIGWTCLTARGRRGSDAPPGDCVGGPIGVESWSTEHSVVSRWGLPTSGLATGHLHGTLLDPGPSPSLYPETMADVRHYDPDEVFDDGGLFERELAECTDPEHHHEYSRHHEGQQRAAAPPKLEDPSPGQ